MSRPWKRMFLMLAALFIMANIFWFWLFMDQASIAKYRSQLLYEESQSLDRLMAILPHILGDFSKPEIVALIQEEFPGEVPFEKDGTTNIAFLSFKFSDDGRLIQVSTESVGKTLPGK